MKEGKQFLKLDGPIGRKQYFFVILFLYAYTFISTIILVIFHTFVEVNKYNLILFIILWTLYLIPTLYITWVNLTKRIWDLIGDKTNAIFYASALWIASIATSFIPVVKYIWTVLAIVISCILLFKKGQLLKYNKPRKDAK